MSDQWQTYPFEFRGGLVSNLSPLQQGLQAPGSARILRNYEPSVEGGYRRIEGYEKYSTSTVPKFGSVLVQGSGQTGNTLNVANIYTAPLEGSTLTIAGVTGTYTIDVGGVSYNDSNKTATLTLTASLFNSPADKAVVTITEAGGLLCGIAAWDNYVVACRNSNVYSSTGSAWTKINVPAYGTVEVDGAGQTGSTLVVKGLTGIPQQNDTFSIAGVELVYKVVSSPTVVGGVATLSISPSLDSSPADGADITFLTAARSLGKNRYTK
jgi:hypothetical protein